MGIAAICAAGTAWAHDHAGKRTAPVTPDEKSAYEVARPVLEKYCFKCHTTDGAKAKKKTLGHLNMDTYPFGGHHGDQIGAAVDKVLVGPKPKMPPDDKGAVKGEDLKKILAWTAQVEKATAKK